MQRMPEKGTRVVVGMSGGVDSSAAAALLVDRGYEVIGITLKTYNYDETGGAVQGESSCCSLDGINDARAICAHLDIPHYVLDFSAQFFEQVITPFIDEYLAGRTPNPCVICNRRIKWEELIRRSLQLDAGFIAMGHYARLRGDGAGRFWIARGKDREKDQSYALWAVSQESLARTLFPLAEMTKEEVRSYAARRGLKTAGKGESYEICFVPDDNYSRFLMRQRPGLEQESRGSLVLDGKRVGEHRGYPFYTIGQRRGLNFTAGEPLFVTRIDAAAREVHIGREKDLMHRSFSVHSVNLMKLESIDAPIEVTARIRYKDEGSPATLFPGEDGKLIVRFDKPRRAITPGQSTVWYDGEDLLGGGIIDAVME